MTLAVTWVQTTPIEALRDASARPWYPPWRAWPSPALTVAVVPGEAATREALDREETRQAMIALLRRFADFGLSWYGGELAKITVTTEQVSEAFLRALPASKAFPKVSPDGEGGLMMVWEGAGNPFLLTINDLHLHGVIAARTPHAEYIDGVPLDSAQVIPDKILIAIPAR
ncbi:MAG TPA: hypothetical protein VGP28_09910 [Methylocella sp.]|jgi:hypothetical protein|nr:hypothetical protein [Methylocella sp.]